jgi:hypothetical protein
LPGWGTGELVAVVAAEVISSQNMSTASMPGRPGMWYLDFVLRNGTLQDLTTQVSADGQLEYSSTDVDSAPQRAVFVFYQQRTLAKNLDPQSNRTDTIFDYGCFTVDHFSAKGAKVVIDFWEQYLLSDEIKQLLREVGHAGKMHVSLSMVYTDVCIGWEDSVELRSNISWSPSLPTRFESLIGYDLKPFLPLIMFGNNNINIQSGNPGKLRATLDTPDMGLGYLNDYRRVLQAGYQEYLTALQEWLHDSLGLEHSAQVSYNLPMDMEASIPYVGVPECESLQFLDRVDAYRQFSGSSSLAGKNVVSIELGAVFGRAYEFTVLDLAFTINRAASGGINAYVIHGQTYTGNYFGTTWPGYTSFGYHVSDMYSEKRPDWNHGMRELLDYVARVEWSQQRGILKTDVVFYNRQSATKPVPTTIYLENDLLDEGMVPQRSSSNQLTLVGWSYSYISPDNFLLPEATVSNGVLAADGPAFKAMVIESIQNLTLKAVVKLQGYAEAGLPIIITGDGPGYYPLSDSKDEGQVERATKTLLASKGVHIVEKGGVAAKLRALNLAPNAGVQTNGTWYTTFRQDSIGGSDYVFIFCDTNASSGEVTIASSKKPWSYNLWTGEVSPLIHYRHTGNTTIVPLDLKGNQTALIVLTDHDSTQVEGLGISIVNMPEGILGLNYSSSDGLILQVSAMACGTAELSNGRSVPVSGSGVPDAFALRNWTLVAEHWEAGSNFSDASVIADKHNTTHELEALVSWLNIEPLANVSGLGYYSTSFHWPPTADCNYLGAFIEFPRLINALLVWVNGKKIPSINNANPVSEISPYLIEGENEVLAIVPTTMLNYVLTLLPEINNLGSRPTFRPGPLTSIGNATDNGLIGTVRILPYKKVRIQ